MTTIPAAALWQHLGPTPSLPWSLGLRVEVDGVLEDEVHDALIKTYPTGSSTYLFCAAAFRPLVGKQYVAWRFIQPDTLVCAVKTAGCSVASAGGGGGEVEEQEEEEEEEEEDAIPLLAKQRQQPHTALKRCATGPPPLPPRQQPLTSHAHTASKHGATGTLGDLEEARGPSMPVRKHEQLQVWRWWAGGACRS